MKNIKKILSVMLIIAMVFSIVGCSNAEESSENDKVVIEQEKVNTTGKIENSGFENGLNEYWGLESLGTGTTEVVEKEDTSDETESALKISTTAHYVSNVYQNIEGLTPGYYYMTAYAKNSGNHNACYLYANGSDQEQTMTAIPVSDEWKKVTVRGIEVGDDGKAVIGIYADSNDGNWVMLDDITITYETNQETKYPSLFGGAVSRLTWEEDMGAKYYDSYGEEGDAIEIMSENGMNFARLELYNSPGKGRGQKSYYCPEGYQDPADILSLAKRAKDAGMALELTFFYADYWDNSCIPADWQEAIEGKSEEEAVDILEEKVYEFTKDYLEQMESQGTLPEYVSLGNEMQGGILLPYGSYENMDNLKRFLNAGYKAVKEVSDDIQVILHISCNADDVKWNGNGMGSWFFGLCEQYGINYDIIGTSFYPYWAETLTVDDFVDWANLMIDKFDKDIVVMETGYNWISSDESGLGGQLDNNGAYEGIYESSPEGQRDFLIEMINGIKSVKDGRCIGDLYWDPLFVEQEGCGWAIKEYNDEADKNVISNTTLFDDNHVALPAFDAYKFNVVGGDITADSVNYIDNSNGIYTKTAELKYFYEGEGIPKIVFQSGNTVEMSEFTEADSSLDDDVDGIWYVCPVNFSDGDFEIVDGDGNKVIAIGNNENATMYTNILKGYSTYLRDGEIYSTIEDAFEKYFIAGSTDDWEAKDGGVFSNYWASGDEWLDELEKNEDGTYSITLKDANPEYTYVFNVYRNKDMNQKVFSDNKQFTVNDECDVVVTIDVEKDEVTYKAVK